MIEPKYVKANPKQILECYLALEKITNERRDSGGMLQQQGQQSRQLAHPAHLPAGRQRGIPIRCTMNRRSRAKKGTVLT